jgi:C-terminal processing protease CtpA/Prc
LYFDTSQRTEERRIARVELAPRVPSFREDQFRGLFAPPGQDSPARQIEIVPEGIRSRLTLLDPGIDVEEFDLSPDGKSIVVLARGLYTFPVEERRPNDVAPRQITASTGALSAIQFAPDGKEILFLERGRAQAVNLESPRKSAIEISAAMDIDFHQEKLEVFRQAWTYLRDHFFDEKFNGAEWAALRKQYELLAAGSRSVGELRRIIHLMLGELNASHLGIGPDNADEGQTSDGRLGLAIDSEFRVTEVIPLGPAALAGIKPGEFLLAIDGVKLAAGVNLHEQLEFKREKKVELLVSPAQGGAQSRAVAVQPISLRDEKMLRYRAWVDERRVYVAKISSGRLGYVHMLDMSPGSLARLYLDLDVETHSREGVVVDIRNNSGGFVNAYALDVFARKPYLTFLERNRQPVPARSALGQRSLELPTILVTSQHSLSDAEDFTEGYRRLKLGKVVGEPTAGWIIYTANQKLVDGSVLRLPRTKVFDNDGALMEMHPRPVDVPAQRPIGESYTGKDVQLETAVRELLRQIEASRTRPTQ